MNQILAMREKRASLWDAAKKYRDAHIANDGTMTAEDAAVTTVWSMMLTA